MNPLNRFLFRHVIPAIGKGNAGKNHYINVIYYHDIVPGEGYSYMRTNQSVFFSHMEYLAKNGYQTVTFSELNEPSACDFQKKKVLITFDDGWKSNYEILPRMKEYGLKYNVFLAAGAIGNDPDYLSWEQVEEMGASGLCGFGAHTYDHVEFGSLEGFDPVRQIDRTNQLISEHTGEEVRDFCFPCGTYSEETVRYLAEHSPYTRIYTSDMNYTYPKDGKLIFGRNAIHNDSPLSVFQKKTDGYYNIFTKLRGLV